MKHLESLLGWIAAGLFVGTGLLALAWVVMIAFNLLTAPPNTIIAPDADQLAVTNQTEAPAETTVSTTPEPAPEATPEPETEPVAITVSAEAGEKVFKKCKACHDNAEDGKNKTGPNLWQIVGRPTASVEGFEYSDAMLGRAGEPWTEDFLQTYLANPNDVVPGTSMKFAGLKKDADILNVIAYLGQQAPASQSPTAPAAPASADTAEAPAASDAPAAVSDATTEAAGIEYDEIFWPEDVTYTNPPERPETEIESILARVAALEAESATLDYERARYHPIHFPPAINQASNEECLVCHREILDHTPREVSPAGVPLDATLAWYQTLDTYEGPQSTFHYRHLESDFAKTVMNLDCVFCHKGNDPREETPDMMPTRAANTAPSVPEFTLRKMVNPSTTCLLCHGATPDPEEIMGLGGPWHEVRADMEYPESPNGCMTCHAETYRTVRHNVSYLNALNIEEYARAGSSDSCYGCHGGRSWYLISYPYPRHEWPLMEDMVGSEVPEWAIGRPTGSDPEYALPATAE